MGKLLGRASKGREINSKVWADARECIGLGNRKPYQHHMFGSHNRVWSFFFFKHGIWCSRETWISSHTGSFFTYHSLSVADGQPVYSQQKSRPRALLLPLTKENVPEGPKRAQRAGSSLYPSFYVSVWHWAVHLRHLWASVSSPDIRLGLKLSKAITSSPHCDIPGTRRSASIHLTAGLDEGRLIVNVRLLPHALFRPWEVKTFPPIKVPNVVLQK